MAERFTSMANELTFGTLPTSGYVRLLTLTSNTLNLNRDVIPSNAIFGGRGLQNVRPGNDNVTGGLAFEIGVKGLGKPLYHLLGVGYSDGSTPGASSTLSVSASAGATSVTVTDASGFSANNYVRIDNVISLKSEIRKIVSISSNTLNLDFPLTYNHSSGATVTKVNPPFTHVFKRGVLPVGFTVQKHFEDLNQFYKYSGCRVMSGTITIPQTGLATLELDIRGKTSVLAATPTGTVGSAETVTPYISWEGAVLEDGSSIGYVTSLTATINNELDDGIFVLGSRERYKLPEGRGGASGTLSIFVEDSTLINKFRNETPSSIKLTTTNGTNQFIIEFPNVKYTGGAGDPQMASAFGPITLELPFQALYDPGENTDVKITYVTQDHIF
jgi:hypothetical protein